jgi:hypothetical protein
MLCSVTQRKVCPLKVVPNYPMLFVLAKVPYYLMSRMLCSVTPRKACPLKVVPYYLMMSRMICSVNQRKVRPLKVVPSSQILFVLEEVPYSLMLSALEVPYYLISRESRVDD